MKFKGLITTTKNYILSHKLGSMTTVSLIGLGVTVLTTVLATKNTIYDLADAQYNYEEENGEGAILPKKEKAKIIVKNSIGPAFSTGVTATSIVCSYKEASKEIQSGIMAINALSEAREFERLYRRKVAERLGDKEDRKIRDEVALEQAKDAGKEYIINGCIYDTGHGNTIFMDKAGGFLYKSSFDAVYKAYDRWFGYVNNGSCEFSSFNELYYLLDLHIQTQLGETEGIISSYDKGFSTHQLSINEDLNVKCDDTILGPEHVVNLVYIDEEYVRHIKEVF